MLPAFIHVPRTGGNSLLPHLYEKHIRIVHHVEKEDLSTIRDNWVFSFLRDPCQRVISSYAYLRDGGLSDQDKQDFESYVQPFKDFEDFVFRGLSIASTHQRHFRPQKYWISDEQGNVKANFLGRTERIQQDFDRVCECCGWAKVQLGVLNFSHRNGLACTSSMRDYIQQMYAEDYALLQELEGKLHSGLMGRILRTYQRNQSGEVRDVIWNICTAKARETQLTEDNLKNMCQTTLVAGFGGGLGAKEVKFLAEAMGVCGISNPEADAHSGIHQPPKSNVDALSVDDVLDKIQEKFPAFIHFPPFSGNCLQGCITSRHGILSNRHIYYLWIFKRIMEICPDRASPIIEVGAGFGVLGYYLHGLGYRDYTIVDLSLTNACQTYFLSQNLCDRKLILSGDVPDPFDLCHRDAIKILHSTDFHDVPRDRFAVMVNMDGLTEYGVEEATRYVQSDCAGMLYSINHEVNSYRVCELSQPHRIQKFRNLFWLRPGYVEELYVRK